MTLEEWLANPTRYETDRRLVVRQEAYDYWVETCGKQSAEAHLKVLTTIL